jgi:predicted negative regulator of RcsB-dependent stress response
MAQATRTSASPARHSDDPIENVMDWFTLNRKPILTLLGVIAAIALIILGYRWWDASKRKDASAALYQAQAPLAQGVTKDAEPALERVVNKYGGTAAGQQAALVLAQVRYENGKHAEGIKGLEDAVGSASDDFKSAFEQMIAMGYEAQGKREQAAEHYGKAAELAKFDGEKSQYQASQARHLMATGKLAEAKAIWEQLSQREDLPVYQEARVRLGELQGAAK